jgi:predicted phosphodiesterase
LHSFCSLAIFTHNNMRIALISDIHSNLEALTKALEIIDKSSIDEIICLGDIVGYGANPNECLDLVRQRCKIVVKGNHDEAVLDLEITHRFTDDARSAVMWTHGKISAANIDYLKMLPLKQKKNNLLFVHSSPCNPEVWNYIFGDDTAADSFQCFSESLCFIGHTHIPAVFSTNGRTRGITKNERYIINVGSIGQPRDRNTQLSFGIIDTDEWAYENIRNPYDTETAAKKILDAGLPSRLGHRLLIGV